MKTKKVLAVFTAVATTAAFAYYMVENLDMPEEQQVEGTQTLLDDAGEEYTLTQNEDGSETATYEDGRSVTIKREEDGTLRYLHGTEGLIAGLAAGYYMFHGLSGGAGGHYSPGLGRYIPSGPVQPLKEKDRQYSSTASRTYSSSSRGGTMRTGSSSSKNSSTAKSSSHSSSKSGFGSAGARSSAS